MQPDTLVYCTNCKHFELKEDNPDCCFEYECCIWNCEDGMPYKKRPYYKEGRNCNDCVWNTDEFSIDGNCISHEPCWSDFGAYKKKEKIHEN